MAISIPAPLAKARPAARRLGRYVTAPHIILSFLFILFMFYLIVFPLGRMPDEMDILLELTNDGRVGFCYDVGHAQALDHLGFGPHQEWLRRLASRIIEVHLHDIAGLCDHLAPGLGQVDWDMVAHYLPREVIHTFECRSFNTPQELKAGVRLLAEKGCVRQV